MVLFAVYTLRIIFFFFFFFFFSMLAAPQVPRVREADVKQLVEMFPTLEKDVIHSVLEANNGRVDSAVTSLLQMTET